MSVTYNCARKDITFCTMLFKMPNQGDLSQIKNDDRRFEYFYLPSLKKLCEVFDNISLWCDQETADYLRAHGLAKRINMRVMKLSDLPHWGERESALKIMHSMKKYVGYFLHHRKPETWVDYLPLMWAKAAIIDWAAKKNKFNSKYFMWIDAGAFSPKYANSSLWDNWTGAITARPHFVPRFVYDLYKWLFVPPIAPATSETLSRQNLIDIAMTNADYDVPGGSFMVPEKLCSAFYQSFERARKILKRHNLVCVDQGVFQTMMKFDTDNMFELRYINGYDGIYNAVANGAPDCML